MREHIYQKTWFKNLVLILIPTLISVIGVIISNVNNQTSKIFLISGSIILLIILIIFMIYSSNFEESILLESQKMKEKNITLTNILAHIENDCNIAMCEIAAISDIADKWASNINSFVNNIKANGQISDKAWDKVKYIDKICINCRDIIEQYCNIADSSKISVGYVQYTKDDNGEEWVHMISHSNAYSLRPNACKTEVKLSDCLYHYGDLIKERYSDIEIAMNNEEILRIFHKVSVHTDLSKYTQYIAVPLYCKSGKILGVLQIVTKNGYIIENDRNKLEKFVTENIVPLCNLIILTDKIYKGLYLNPVKINKEV